MSESERSEGESVPDTGRDNAAEPSGPSPQPQQFGDQDAGRRRRRGRRGRGGGYGGQRPQFGGQQLRPPQPAAREETNKPASWRPTSAVKPSGSVAVSRDGAAPARAVDGGSGVEASSATTKRSGA